MTDAIAYPGEPGRPRNPEEPPTTPDGDPQRRDAPANEPINPEPEQPPEPVPITEPGKDPAQTLWRLAAFGAYEMRAVGDGGGRAHGGCNEDRFRNLAFGDA